MVQGNKTASQTVRRDIAICMGCVEDLIHCTAALRSLDDRELSRDYSALISAGVMDSSLNFKGKTVRDAEMYLSLAVFSDDLKRKRPARFISRKKAMKRYASLLRDGAGDRFCRVRMLVLTTCERVRLFESKIETIESDVDVAGGVCGGDTDLRKIRDAMDTAKAELARWESAPFL